MTSSSSVRSNALESAVEALLERMTLAEKIGQMNQVNGDGGHVSEPLREAIRAGRVGSVINEVDRETVEALQRIAIDESRLGIPLLIGRDVIHGFRTIMPIPLGQAATWNPALVRDCAAAAAREAASEGINWTFAPMMDVTREPRWGRIAESPGEDPYLACALVTAMIDGFQGPDLREAGRIAACAKHFAGYGAVESGRDYASTDIPHNELRNVHLPAFRAAVTAGVSSVMTSFSDLDGIPATANEFLLRQVLREEWGFDGLVVSDYDSVRQLAIHGLTGNDVQSVRAAATAGVDMEMAGGAYLSQLPELIASGELAESLIDRSVANVLRVKFRLGLFDDPKARRPQPPAPEHIDARTLAYRAALESVVMLRNENRALPLEADDLRRVAVIGPLSNAPYEQLGTWVFDGDPELSVTPLDAIRTVGDGRFQVDYVEAMQTSRSRASAAFDDAVSAAAGADAALVFLGEEAILSGEAHSRADIGLPGDQAQLLRRVHATGTPVVAVILAGRPLVLTDLLDYTDALLFAWHPGTMAGPAIADLLFGAESPSGKLPVTLPRAVGQIPIYYSQKNTGRPPSKESIVHIDDIDPFAPQTSLGMTAFHLDAGYRPLFAFGFGLSYGEFHYDEIRLDREQLAPGDTLRVSFELCNRGPAAAEEVAQLYVRDMVGSITRPVRELKGFQRVCLAPGERRTLHFDLRTDALEFYGARGRYETEPGEFRVWVGGNSDASLGASFRLEDAS